MTKPKLIKNWDELAKVPDSETHTIVIDTGYSGWLCNKDSKSKQRKQYLSTHTFYGSQYKRSTADFQRCGFNIEIDNWDKE